MNESNFSYTERGPARPDRQTVDFYQEADALVLRMPRGGGPWLFLLLWLIAWTIGCVALLDKVLNDPAPWILVFALPFWASWLLVAALIVWMLFCRETLYLDSDEARFVRTAVVRLSARIVPRKEIKGFHECRSNYAENDQYLWGIEMVTLGKSMRFAFRLPEQERTWLIYQLNAFLKLPEVEKERRTAGSAEDIPQTSDSHSTVGAPITTEILFSKNTLAEAPTDCRWQLTEDFDNFAFLQKGRLNLGGLAMLLFVNVFWNGIVAVFVMGLFGLAPVQKPLQGWEWWGLFVFLIPFEVIGLAMLAALISAVLEPLRRTIWEFEKDRIVTRTVWSLYRRMHVFHVLGLDRLELRCSNGDGSEGKWTAEPFKLAFIATDTVDLCEIGKLTEGEARWIAHIILGRRSRWFHA